MDIQAIIDQVTAAVKDAPEKLGDLAQDPKAAIEGIIGEGNLGDIDPTEILAGMKDRVADIDLGAISEDVQGALKGIFESATAEGGIADQVGDFLGGLFNKK